MSFYAWHNRFFVGIIGLLLFVGVFYLGKKIMVRENLVDSMRGSENKDDVVALFFKSPKEIKSAVNCYMQSAQEAVDAIIAVPAQKRTFENTAWALDRIGIADVSIAGSLCATLEVVSPDEEIRKAAHEAIVQIQNFSIDAINNNKKLYQAFKDYVETNAKTEKLNEQQQYFLTETMQDWKRAGLDLLDDELDQVKALQKELAELTLTFDSNIAADVSTITVSRDDLKGIDQAFIDSLKKTDEGDYILGIDYPTYFNIMDNCAVADTRKRLSTAFSNRAYPANEQLLKDIIAKRDMLAKKLGFESYAALNLDSQMVGSPLRAREFLTDLISRSSVKEKKELAAWTNELPESVVLTDDGKINPWDIAFIQNQYKKKYLAVDEEVIKEYFPMEKTIDGLLDIYRTFFSIDFEKVPVSGLWHEDVQLVKVFNKDRTQLYGFLLLDLHPRPNKYSHAAHMTIIPSLLNDDGSRFATSVSLVMANFPKATGSKPALLTRSDVRTFFHEFGHALHAILGATHLASFSGTSVKTDFVELPSQMLEEWLWDSAMLKKVSSHFKTGSPLPDDIIEKIIALKRYDSGYWVKRQGFLSLISLNYFGPGDDKDPYALFQSLKAELSPEFAVDPSNHFYASFGHLTGYGARYYGYLWSKVFALDIFNEIKKHGLLDPAIGQRYIHEVIGKGGSQDPNQLLRNFLQREPSSQAFFDDLGL